jgi:hypothetical protein
MSSTSKRDYQRARLGYGLTDEQCTPEQLAARQRNRDYQRARLGYGLADEQCTPAQLAARQRNRTRAG